MGIPVLKRRLYVETGSEKLIDEKETLTQYVESQIKLRELLLQNDKTFWETTSMF